MTYAVGSARLVRPRIGTVLLPGVLISLSVGCERKAPGPAECETFAYQALGVHDERLRTLAVVQEMVAELVRVCLTTPYDRKLTECVAARPVESALQGNRLRLDISPAAQLCLAEFKLRKARSQSEREAP